MLLHIQPISLSPADERRANDNKKGVPSQTTTRRVSPRTSSADRDSRNPSAARTLSSIESRGASGALRTPQQFRADRRLRDDSAKQENAEQCERGCLLCGHATRTRARLACAQRPRHNSRAWMAIKYKSMQNAAACLESSTIALQSVTIASPSRTSTASALGKSIRCCTSGPGAAATTGASAVVAAGAAGATTAVFSRDVSSSAYASPRNNYDTANLLSIPVASCLPRERRRVQPRPQLQCRERVPLPLPLPLA